MAPSHLKRKNSQIIRSPVAGKLGLETSFLERIMLNPQYNHENIEYRGITYSKLVQNYRNHPAILATSNKEFYAGELQACAPVSITASLRQWDGWPNKNFPIIFHSVKGVDEREGTSPSFFNVSEISTVRQYVESLRKSKKVKVVDSDIGALSSFEALDDSYETDDTSVRQASSLRTQLSARSYALL